MAEQTVAASSPAEEVDVFNGESPSRAEFDHWRTTGELPERFKPAEEADAAPADAPEQTVESEGEEPESEPDSEPEETQEQPPKGSGAERRIKQLLAEKKELQRKLEAAAKQDVKTESSTAQAAPQSVPNTRPKPTADDKNQDGTSKFKTYEDFVEDLADWKSEQQIARFKWEQAQQQQLNAVRVKMEEARSRYEDADEVILPAAKAIHEAQIPAAVKQVFADSDHFTDLCYVVGSDPDELTKFISLAQSNPRAALAKVFEYERGIREALDSPGEEEPKSGKAPEKQQTKAPKPPAPVGGGSSRAFDVSDESLPADEWMRKRNADLKKRGKA